MSLATKPQTERCSNCGQLVTLRRNSYGRLSVGCECRTVDAKVAAKTPETWRADE